MGDRKFRISPFRHAALSVLWVQQAGGGGEGGSCFPTVLAGGPEGWGQLRDLGSSDGEPESPPPAALKVCWGTGPGSTGHGDLGASSPGHPAPRALCQPGKEVGFPGPPFHTRPTRRSPCGPLSGHSGGPERSGPSCCAHRSRRSPGTVKLKAQAPGLGIPRKDQRITLCPTICSAALPCLSRHPALPGEPHHTVPAPRDTHSRNPPPPILSHQVILGRDRGLSSSPAGLGPEQGRWPREGAQKLPLRPLPIGPAN